MSHSSPHLTMTTLFSTLVNAHCAECAGPSIMSANVVLSITWKHPRALNTGKMDGPRSCSRHICSSSLASSSFLHSSFFSAGTRRCIIKKQGPAELLPKYYSHQSKQAGKNYKRSTSLITPMKKKIKTYKKSLKKD